MTAVESRLSTYGASTPRELISEAFTEYRASAQPRPLARAVGELINRLYSARAQETTPTPRAREEATARTREEVYARRRGPADDPEADPDLWALRAMDKRMSESRYRDEDAERQAGKILQRIANTWGRDGAQWLLDRFQARSPYVRDGIAWAARQNGVGEPAGDRQTSRPPSQAGQAQEAAYQAESLYDSQADRSHWREVMREADHLAHEYTAADRNQDADAFQDAIDNAQAFVRRHGLADADRTPWYKFKGAAQMDDSGTKGYEPPILDHDDFGEVNVERRVKVPLAGLRPQQVEDYPNASNPLSEEHKEAMRQAYEELRKFIENLGARQVRFGDLLAIINKVNPTGHNRTGTPWKADTASTTSSRPAEKGRTAT